VRSRALDPFCQHVVHMCESSHTPKALATMVSEGSINSIRDNVQSEPNELCHRHEKLAGIVSERVVNSTTWPSYCSRLIMRKTLRALHSTHYDIFEQ
jgi:hypothetical protein